MNKNTALPTLTALALVAALAVSMPAWSQVAGGTTTVDVSINETTRLALGWSVKKTLLGDEATKSFEVVVLTTKGDVRLSGVMDTQAQKDQALVVARAIEGVHTVHDEITVKP